MPDFGLELVHGDYTGRYTKRDPIKGRERLRYWVLTAEPDEIELNRRHAIEDDWDKAFLKDLEAEIAWYRDLRAGDPRRPYDLGKAYQARAGSQTERFIGNALVRMAHDLGLPVATFELALERLESGDDFKRSVGRGFLRSAAFDGHVPALVEIVARLREGRGFERDDVETYYWLLRSREAGLDVEDPIRALESALSEAQRAKARGWLTLGHYPRRWDREG